MSLTKEEDGKIIFRVLLFFSLCFIAMGVVYGLMNNEISDMIPGFIRILKTPSQCTQDLYGVSVPGTYLNMGLSGLLMILFIIITKAVPNSGTIAAFFLTIGFTTWGMNPMNMLPSMLGIMVYAKIMKKTPGSMINLCFFSTALAPLMSEVILRWPFYGGEGSPLAVAGQSNLAFQPMGFILALIMGLIVGLVYPPICGHSPNMHKGYNLFNAGPPAGFLCAIMVGILFKLTNTPEPANGPGSAKEVFEFVVIAYFLIFLVCFIWGKSLDKEALSNYKKILDDPGINTDFIGRYGIGATLINFAIYGWFILLFYALMKFLFNATFAGPIAGVVWCAFTFVAAGTHPKNVLPIACGYVVASLISTVVFPTLGLGNDTGRLSMSTMAILIAFSYSTGLAPIAGHFGFIAGLVAGILHFALVTLSPRLYYFFNYYNGGMTAGLVAFEMVPVLEAYFPRKKKEGEQ